MNLQKSLWSLSLNDFKTNFIFEERTIVSRQYYRTSVVLVDIVTRWMQVDMFSTRMLQELMLRCGYVSWKECKVCRSLNWMGFVFNQNVRLAQEFGRDSRNEHDFDNKSSKIQSQYYSFLSCVHTCVPLLHMSSSSVFKTTSHFFIKFSWKHIKFHQILTFLIKIFVFIHNGSHSPICISTQNISSK